MKTSLKQWRRLGLGLMLTWVLLFLALFSYFMETRVDEPHSAAALSHTDTHRLSLVRGNPRAIMASRLEPPTGSGPAASSTQLEQSLEQNPSSEPQEAYPYPDPQSLAAWSAFGTQDVGMETYKRQRQDNLQNLPNQELEEEEEEVAGGRTIQ